MDLSPPSAFVAGLSALAPGYRALLCDVWGVLHNGFQSFPDAVDALCRFRIGGGVVVLITNAPRPAWSVRDQLDSLGVDHDGYDDIVTSGDVASAILSERGVERIYHLGPQRDIPIYQTVKAELCDADSAQIISCTGLFDDETEQPEDYDPLLRQFADRGIEMICSNPDLLVKRRDTLVPCAGAVAARYELLGGAATVVGKPYPRIYDNAIAAISRVAGKAVERSAILAVGDGAQTDIRGANDASLDSLFISAGVHADEYGADVHHVRGFLGRSNAHASNVMPRLSW